MAYNDGGRVVTNGMILSIDAADRNSYISGSATYYDLSSNAYTASGVNSVSYSLAAGGTFEFSGSRNSQIRFEDRSAGSATDNYTWECWFRPVNAANTTQGTPLCRGNDGAGSGWSLFIAYSSSSISSAIVTTLPTTVGTSSNYIFPPGQRISTSSWYHAVGTWTASTKLDLYLNGSFISTVPMSGRTTLRTSTVGWNLGRVTTTTNNMTGSVALARVYNRVLSAQEIKQNYDAQKARFGLT